MLLVRCECFPSAVPFSDQRFDACAVMHGLHAHAKATRVRQIPVFLAVRSISIHGVSCRISHSGAACSLPLSGHDREQMKGGTSRTLRRAWGKASGG